MPGGRLTNEDRQHIAAGLAKGLGYAEIGRRLERPASTIMREVTRNGGPDDYRADRAQKATRQRARRQKQAQPPAPPIPDGGHGRDPQAVQEVAESFTELLIQQGLPRMEARVLACLQITDSGALTAADLVERLRVSPASISHAVAFLEQQGMLRRELVPGGRRERYVIDDEIGLRNLLTAVQMSVALAAASQRAAEILGPTTPAGARFESSAELTLLVSEALRQAMEQWRQRLAARSAG
ncbi:DNA-binding MarR family transcriptional regulator [Rhodococcus sp. PvR044]|jgi:DNA-binding MarR family transcriptional regulator|uniref:GbsR/MarR family transcriptional regulator n=1 Tax=unclassified Rhodococcus (in: high G+C Gram-positive bacteria) TaxID=192944 RepID=UPI000BDCAF35|nr:MULTISPECIES: helix-turn-helix domain-containing protein [unclassified Rhodococcus (in: high G+C Gram-positive bacteria)]MBP1162013.1 DNA-binding MarR family transcriptional regulator [Rhodococcus sp. PvR099]PTR43276.1 MarR family protein [Rhodococcus sp. OK611]SNX91139.1 MarR family protein [Rhodococcus sp. OK270]